MHHVLHMLCFPGSFHPLRVHRTFPQPLCESRRERASARARARDECVCCVRMCELSAQQIPHALRRARARTLAFGDRDEHLSTSIYTLCQPQRNRDHRRASVQTNRLITATASDRTRARRVRHHCAQPKRPISN